MKPTFHQYTPRELFLGISLSKESSDGLHKGMYKTGCEVFDAFLSNFYEHGIRSSTFHAEKLGIAKADLRGMVRLHTGMAYPEFTKQLVLLMAKELLSSEKWGQMDECSKRLGFGSYATLYKLLMECEQKTPTEYINQHKLK